jgi:DNA polymerase-3 subunit delta
MTKATSRQAFFGVLEKNELPSVVAFGGDERVLVDDALVLLRKRALSGGLADFNHDRVSARERRGRDIVSLCNTLPVMAPRRLVEVRDADAATEEDVEALAAYVDAPNRESVLCLVLADVDERGRLAKMLVKSSHALLCRFDHPRANEMAQEVEWRAQRLGVVLAPGAAEALAMTVGNDLTLLERGLEKLSIAVSGDVSVDAVGEHVADTHLEDAFAWVRAIALGDREAAVRATAALQAAREEPLRLLGLLAWQLRQVATARALLDVGRDPARELKLFGDRVAPVITAARRFDAIRHAARLVRLADADRALKSSRQPPWLQMHRMVLDLTVPVASTAGKLARAKTANA